MVGHLAPLGDWAVVVTGDRESTVAERIAATNSVRKNFTQNMAAVTTTTCEE